MDYCEDCSRNCRAMDSNDRPAHRTPRTSSHKTPRLRSLTLVASSLLVVLLATVIPLSLASSTCSRHEYWDAKSGECVQCSKCSQHEIVIRSCQRHMNAVCQALNTYTVERPTERPAHHHQPPPERISAPPSTQEDNEAAMDWQVVSLALAVVACLMFFIGTALISLNYVRQWRKIKKQFDNDIEGLSQQLMARLAMPNHEGSSIFIDDPTAKRGALAPRQIEVRCVYLEDILDGKEPIKEPKSQPPSRLPRGNVYINEHEKKSRHHETVHGPRYN